MLSELNGLNGPLKEESSKGDGGHANLLSAELETLRFRLLFKATVPVSRSSCEIEKVKFKLNLVYISRFERLIKAFRRT